MPKNHNKVINEILKIYVRTDKITKIKKLHQKFDKEIKPRSPKDAIEDDETNPESDDEEDDTQSPNKKPSKGKPGDKDNNEKTKPGKSGKGGKDGDEDDGKDKPKKPKDSKDKDDGEDDESEKPENNDEKFKKEKKDLQTVEIDDSEETYSKKTKLIRSIKFEQYRKNVKRYTNIFKFKIRTRHLFRLIKHCYRFRRMPKNHNKVINEILKIYVRNDKITKIKKLHQKFDKEIKPRSPKDVIDDDETEPETDDKEDDAQPSIKIPSERKPLNKYKNGKRKPGIPEKEEKYGESNYDENKLKRPKFSKNKNRHIRVEGKSSSENEVDSDEPEELMDDSNKSDTEDYFPEKKPLQDKSRDYGQKDESEKGDDKFMRPSDRDSNEKFKKEKNELKRKKIYEDGDSYIEKRDLFREITSFERYQSRRNLRRFRSLFKFQIRTKRLFQLLKHCYRFNKIPKNFNQVMNIILNMYTNLDKINEISRLYKRYQREIKPTIERDAPDADEEELQTEEGIQESIQSDSIEVDESINPGSSDTRDENEKFKKEKNELKRKKITDDEDSYRGKRDLLREIISFKRYQSRHYVRRFRALFKFQIRTKYLFQFIKYCYRFKKIPKNFNQVMNKILRIYTKLEKINEISRLYTIYQREIKPRMGKDVPDTDEDQPQRDEGTEEDDQLANKKPTKNTRGDIGRTGKNKSEQSKRNRGKGKGYEHEKPEESFDDSDERTSEDDQPSEKLPNNKTGGKKDENGVSEENESINVEYTKDDEKKFIKEKIYLKDVKITDDEESYEEKTDLLKTMTFNEYQSRRYVKRVFKFNIKTRRLFNLIKHWYRFKRMPKNHNEVINKILKIYSKLRKINEISKLYKIYNKEIKPRSQRNLPNKDDYQPQEEEEDESQLPYKRPRDLNEIDNNEMVDDDENSVKKSEKYRPKSKTRKPSTTGANKENEAEDSTNNSDEGKNAPDNSQRKYIKTVNIQDSNRIYLTKHLFLRYLTFKQYNTPRNLNKFYKLFGFRIKTKLFFNFIKHCYRFKRMPKNHNRVLNKLLGILKILRPHTLHKYLNFFFKKYDEGVSLYTNEGLRNSAENKNSNKFNGGGSNNKNKGNRMGGGVFSTFKPITISKNGPNYNRINKPKEDSRFGKDSTKDQDDSNVEHFFGNDEGSESGSNNQSTKENIPQTGSKPNNMNQYYFNGQLRSGYNAYENTDRLINTNNQQLSTYLETSQNSVQNNDIDTQSSNSYQQNDENQSASQNRMEYNNINLLRNSMSTGMNQQSSFNSNNNIQDYSENEKSISSVTNDNNNLQNQITDNIQMTYNSNENIQYDNTQSGSQYNMGYENTNSQMDSMFTDINQQSSFNSFKAQDSNENEKQIFFNANENNNILNQGTNNYQMTYNSDQQYDNTQSQSQFMKYDSMNSLTDSVSTSLNQQPSTTQSEYGINSQNYYTNDFNTNSMTSLNQEQYNNQLNNFQNVLNSGVQSVSQSNMQDVTLDNAIINQQQYSNINQQQYANINQQQNANINQQQYANINQQQNANINQQQYANINQQQNANINQQQYPNINQQQNDYINQQQYANQQQYTDSVTASSYNTQDDNTQFDFTQFEQNLQNDMGQADNDDFIDGNQLDN